MFACISIDWNGHKVRGSFHHTLAKAIEYAERMMGVIEIEEIGKGTVWTREKDLKPS